MARTKTIVEPLSVDVDGAAALLSLSAGHVRRLTMNGELPSYRVGRLRFYRIRALERWIGEREAEERRIAQAGDFLDDEVPA